MEKEQIQQQKHDAGKVCKMLYAIAVECQAIEEKQLCESIAKELAGQNKEQHNALQKNQLNRVAGNLLLNYLEPKLIVAVMDGEDMREKLKLLQPRINSTKTRLENQVLQERQKMERQVVKYVMNFEANYHIMIRKIRENLIHLTQAWIEGPPLLMEEELQKSIAKEEQWCMDQTKKDVTELEQEIFSFARELYEIKMKCRQETIQIMDNSFFTMIAQKTERALHMIHYKPVVESIEAVKKKMENQMKHSSLTGIAIDPIMTKQLTDPKQNMQELIASFSRKVQQICTQKEGKIKKEYNEFLKKYLDQMMLQMRKEATDYLNALEKQLTEAVTGAQMRMHVDRDELEHLVDMRNQIAWTFEAMTQKEKSV
ncbi:MAG: hypothetical protein ACI4HI_12925 [Lachnospiraceae bacterium]